MSFYPDLRLLKTSRWPVLKFHAKGQAFRSENFLDLIQRLATKVRSLQQLGFRTLNEITDVVNVLCLQTVGGTYRKFEIVNRTQQDRIDRRRLFNDFLNCGALQVCKNRQLINQDAGSNTHCFFRLDHAIGLDVQHKTVKVCALLHTGALNIEAAAVNRGERSIELDGADGTVIIMADAGGNWLVATALLNFDFHINIAANRQVADDVIRVDHLNIVRQFQITSQDRAFTFLFQGKNDTVTTMQFEYYTLQVQKNVDDILPNTVKSGILMQNASNSNFGRCVTRHRREQDPA
ncbi:hypothetical protein ACG97_12425 [Vogesella sp. EB]|nr:hypothetical protein ACG97_12425 [Vogesella sp. EB]